MRTQMPMFSKIAFFLLALVPLSLCASDNFSSRQGPQYKQFEECAEEARRDIAIFWMGKPLPNWSKPCNLSVSFEKHNGGGATTFVFDQGEVFGWNMKVEGSQAAIIDDVIPHEVQHTILASAKRRVSVRWLDEGMAQLFESEATRQRLMLTAKQFRNSSAACVRNFDALEYPQGEQIIGMYATGYSFCEYLLTLKDHNVLWQFALDKRLPTQKFEAYYGHTWQGLAYGWSAWLERWDGKGYLDKINEEKFISANYQQGKPTLLIVLSRDICLPCINFKLAYNNDAVFRAQIWDLFNVRFGNIEDPNLRNEVNQYNVTSVPQFVVVGTNLKEVGYFGKVRLIATLRNLSQRVPQTPPANNGWEPPPTIPQPQPPVVTPPVPQNFPRYVTREELDSVLGPYLRKGDISIPPAPDLSGFYKKGDFSPEVFVRRDEIPKNIATNDDVVGVIPKVQQQLEGTFLKKDEYEEPKPFPWWLVAAVSGGAGLVGGPVVGGIVSRAISKRYVTKAIRTVKGLTREKKTSLTTEKPVIEPYERPLATPSPAEDRPNPEVERLKEEVQTWETNYEKIRGEKNALLGTINELKQKISSIEQSKPKPSGENLDCAQLKIDLKNREDELKRLQDELEITQSSLLECRQAKQAITQQFVAVDSDQDLKRMRAAHKRVVGSHPESAPYFNLAEQHYKLIQSGE